MATVESGKGAIQSYADFAGLARLRGQAQSDGADATRATAQQFEAMFIQMMLKSMRAASIKSDLVDSQTLDTYESMQDQELSVQLAKRGALGIADLLQRQLSKSQGMKVTGADAGGTSTPAAGARAENPAKPFSLRPAQPAAMVLRSAPGEGFNLDPAARGVLKNPGALSGGLKYE